MDTKQAISMCMSGWVLRGLLLGAHAGKNRIEAPGQSMPGEESILGHARSVPEVSNPFVCN